MRPPYGSCTSTCEHSVHQGVFWRIDQVQIEAKPQNQRWHAYEMSLYHVKDSCPYFETLEVSNSVNVESLDSNCSIFFFFFFFF